MIHFLAGFIVAALIAGALVLIGYRRLVKRTLPVARPGAEVYFYDPTRTTLMLAMVVEEITRRFDGPSTISLIDKSAFLTRNRIPRGFYSDPANRIPRADHQ